MVWFSVINVSDCWNSYEIMAQDVMIITVHHSVVTSESDELLSSAILLEPDSEKSITHL